MSEAPHEPGGGPWPPSPDPDPERPVAEPAAATQPGDPADPGEPGH